MRTISQGADVKDAPNEGDRDGVGQHIRRTRTAGQQSAMGNLYSKIILRTL